MFNVFKTKYSINHPLEYLVNAGSKLFKHPINSGNYECKVCSFGIFSSKLIILYLLTRLLYYNAKINKIILFIIFILSFMNMNVVIYFIPFYILEYILI